ncbi:MAG: SAM domain-containing protein [Verrucomicrobiota bacterium]
MVTQLKAILEKEKLAHLLPVLESQGVTDSLLSDLTDSDLRDLGISKLGERKRLLSAFGQTSNSDAGHPASSAAKRQTTTPQEEFTHDVSNGKITVTGFRGKGGIVIIPDQFDDLPFLVCAIGAEA